MASPLYSRLRRFWCAFTTNSLWLDDKKGVEPLSSEDGKRSTTAGERQIIALVCRIRGSIAADKLTFHI